jgi:hypothetical protein
MAITTTSRVCSSCGRLLPEKGAPVCAHCGILAVPLIAEWPQGLLLALPHLVVARKLSTLLGATRQRQYEWLMRSTFAGERYGQVILPLAATPADCYPIAVRFADAWERASRPKDPETTARLLRELRVVTTPSIDAPTALVGLSA